MAISRAQLLKELLPGLNALFGLEYAKYGEQHKEIYETESSERSFEEETKLSGFSAAPVKNEGSVRLPTITRKRLSLLVTPTRPLLSVSRSRKRPLRTTSMILSPAVTPRLWPVLWLTPSKSRLLPCLNNGFAASLSLAVTESCLVRYSASPRVWWC
jgi:hypothetical protein